VLEMLSKPLDFNSDLLGNGLKPAGLYMHWNRLISVLGLEMFTESSKRHCSIHIIYVCTCVHMHAF
jgi:hypothetical protein